MAKKTKQPPAIESTNTKWFQFNLKTLLLVVLIFSLPLAWFGYERYSYYAHWRTVLPIISQLQNQGVVLIYGTDSDIRADKPEWVRRMVRDIYPERILGVAFQDNCPAETLALLPHLDALNIEIVMFNECQLETTGLKYLRECQHLKRIKMTGGTLNGTGFDQVFLVPDLETLRLEKVPLSAQDLNSLDKATHLQVLALSGITIEAAEMKRLGGLPQLRDLALNDDQLIELQGLNDSTTLETLDLTGSNVNDALLAELQRLPNLRQLILAKTNITTASIPLLTRFTKLESLIVDQLTLGPKDIAALKTMPELKTVVDFSGAIKIRP